jgi:predicted amidophosphoribosyltransferase
MRTFCSTCGTTVDPARQFCGRCGIFAGEWTWAPRDAVVCAACGAPNAPDRTQCGRCFRDPRTGLDPIHAVCGQVRGFEPIDGLAPDGLSVGRSAPSRPVAEGSCPTCGQVNPPGTTFCGSCGTFLEADVAAESDAAANDRTIGPR